MPSKIVQQNVEKLRRLRSGASERVRDMIDEIIDLYSDRKIAQFSTAQKLFIFLKSDNARTVNGAIRRFEKKASQWRTNEELAERMRANTKKEYAITFRVYSKTDTGTGGDAFTDNYGIKYKMIIDERQVIMKSSEKDLIPRNLINKYVVRDEYDRFIKFLKAKLRQKEISKRQYDARATVENFKAENLLTGPSRKPFKEKTKLVEVIHDTQLFESTLKKLLSADKRFRQQFPNLESYADGIKIKDISEITSRSKKRKSEAEEMLRDGNQISMYHTYINTELRESDNSFYEAMYKEGLFQDECWINSLNDHYKNTLMSPNKWKSKRLTREKVLELIGKTYEDFKENGASVEEMKPVFEYFKFPVRIYNSFGYKFYSYDPEIKNKNIPAFFGLVKDNHIYTLNSNTMSLARKILK